MSDSSPSLLPEPFEGEQTVLILVGLIASGKSTFAEALQKYFPKFRRCNQDNLGSRQLVEALARQTLQEGLSPCIDRTNFNAVQRSYWTNITHAFPGTSISVIVFDTPYHVCASRLQYRTSHPTIRNAEEGMPILEKFASELQLPSAGEGYDHLFYLKASDYPSPEYTRDEILSVLSRLRMSMGDGINRNCTSRGSFFGPRGAYTSRGNPVRASGGLHEHRGSWRQSGHSRASYRHTSFSRGRGRYNEKGTVSSETYGAASRSAGSGQGHVPHRGSGPTRAASHGRSRQRPPARLVQARGL
ncbi:hypothetical protein ID866_4485 [Astraeus odoratus]|nr:hypothetical protein ID866_4485 [Astraeus odoratus]